MVSKEVGSIAHRDFCLWTQKTISLASWCPTTTPSHHEEAGALQEPRILPLDEALNLPSPSPLTFLGQSLAALFLVFLKPVGPRLCVLVELGTASREASMKGTVLLPGASDHRKWSLEHHQE